MRIIPLVMLAMIFSCAVHGRDLQPGPQQAPQPVDNRLKPVNSGGLTADAQVGIGGLRDSSLTAAITITVDNQTGKEINGVWEIEEILPPGEDGIKARFLTEKMQLASPSKKRIHLAYRLNDMPLSIRLKQNGKILWQRAIDSYSKTNFSMASFKSLRILTVDPKGKTFTASLPNPTDPQNVQTINASDLPPAGARTVQGVTTPIWGLPTTAEPLFLFHCLIFSDDADIRDLTPGQAKALADYLRWGGRIVLMPKAIKLTAPVFAAMPKGMSERIKPVTDSGPSGLRFYRVGAGRIILSNDQLLKNGADWAVIHSKLANYLSGLPEPSFPRMITPYGGYRGDMPPNAQSSLMHIAGMFALYALFTGPVVLIFFRKRKRKTIAWYVCITVGLFSLLAIVMGPAMGMRKGDIRWLTVTELTPHGGECWAAFTLTSAGGSRHGMTLAGESAKGWLIPAKQILYKQNLYVDPSSSSPLDSASLNNIAFDNIDRAHPETLGDIPITPWGDRVVLANSYWPQGRRLDISVKRQGAKFFASVKNTLPLYINDPVIIIGIWGYGNNNNYYYYNQNRYPEYDVYQLIQLRDLPPESLAEKVNSAIRFSLNHNAITSRFPRLNRYDHRTAPGVAQLFLPRINARKKMRAWFVGSIGAMPGIGLKESDFDANKGAHLIVQEINNLPDADDIIKIHNAPFVIRLKKQPQE